MTVQAKEGLFPLPLSQAWQSLWAWCGAGKPRDGEGNAIPPPREASAHHAGGASVLLEKGKVPLGKCQSLGLGDELISGIRGCAEEELPSRGHWAGEGHLGSIPDVYLWGWGKVPCPLVMPQFHPLKGPYPLSNPNADSVARVPC